MKQDADTDGTVPSISPSAHFFCFLMNNRLIKLPFGHCLYDPCRFVIFVKRHESKNPRHRLLPALFIHLLYKNIYPDLHTGITNGFNAPHELNNGPGWDWMRKINAVG